MEPLATKTADSGIVRARTVELSRELRAAVGAGDHSRAQSLACAYVDALRSNWESLPEEERIEARGLLVWAQQATLIQRSVHAGQLGHLHKASGYRESTAVPGLQVKA